MSQPDYLISTPENVDLHLELAGIGNRILACVIDTLISVALNFVIVLGCLLVAFAMDSFPLPQQAKTIALYYVLGAAVLTILVVSYGYHVFFEGFWRGQTPGKRLAHIRVIEQNGQTVSWTSVIIRNLLRVVDIWIFLVGLVVVLIDRNERRLGDLAAGTLVIRERLPARAAAGLKLKATEPSSAFVDVGRMSPAEYDLLLSFLERREKLSRSQRPLIASKLESYFRNRLQQAADGDSPELFLEKIYLAYKSRAGS
jgi:uncharacterized RDD family membrane protein YckC